MRCLGDCPYVYILEPDDTFESIVSLVEELCCKKVPQELRKQIMHEFYPGDLVIFNQIFEGSIWYIGNQAKVL